VNRNNPGRIVKKAMVNDAQCLPTSSEQLDYRPCVGILLLNEGNLVFVGRRKGAANVGWQAPQGGIDEGEEPRAAAIRELKEEIGTDKAEIIAESHQWYEYDVPEESRPQSWRGRFRGQRQKWFVMRFLGANEEINLQTAKPEFSAWRWVAHQDLLGLVVPFKRHVYRQVLEEFAKLLDCSRSNSPVEL
jgi:putative (di)nucleoside polyphosphate hydrolase